MFCNVARVNVLGLHGNGFLHLSFKPMKPLKAAATTSQPVLTSQQIETIFFKVPELYEIHKEFYDGLFPRVQQWSHQQRVGDLFQKLVSWLQSQSFSYLSFISCVLLQLLLVTLRGLKGWKPVPGVNDRFLALPHCGKSGSHCC